MQKNYEEEILLCHQSFEYFCETYLKVHKYHANNHASVVPMKLWEHQNRWFDHVRNNRFVVHSKFRQGGFTTLAVAYGMWLCLFKLDQTIMYLTHSDRMAVAAGDIAKVMLENLPDWMAGNVLSMSNDHRKKFPDTGSKMLFYTPEASCGVAPTSLFSTRRAASRTWTSTGRPSGRPSAWAGTAS